jgi:hypothetical protein
MYTVSLRDSSQKRAGLPIVIYEVVAHLLETLDAGVMWFTLHVIDAVHP